MHALLYARPMFGMICYMCFIVGCEVRKGVTNHINQSLLVTRFEDNYLVTLAHL